MLEAINGGVAIHSHGKAIRSKVALQMRTPERAIDVLESRVVPVFIFFQISVHSQVCMCSLLVTHCL